MNANKITILNPNSIYQHLQAFLKLHEQNSNNTKETYFRSIKQFFDYFNKDINHLTSSDLNFTRTQIVSYQTDYLYNQLGYSYETIRLKLSALRNFYEYLKMNEINVNPEIFKPNRFPEKSKPYGFLSWDEGLLLAELALKERELGEEKNALFLLAMHTSFRKSALLSLTYDDIRPSEYNPGRYIVTVFDKGKTVEEEISQELYDKLIYLKSNKHKDNKIFHLTEKTINQSIKRLCQKAGFNPKRNITFHSFKKAGVGIVHEITKDIHAAKKQAKHSSVTTTINHYIEDKPNSILLDLLETANVPDDIFDQLTREEMLQLLKSTTNGTKISLKREASKIIKQRTKKAGMN